MNNPLNSQLNNTNASLAQTSEISSLSTRNSLLTSNLVSKVFPTVTSNNATGSSVAANPGGGNTITMNLSDIKFGAGTRRSSDVSTLTQSIQQHGLLHPITVKSCGELIAGRRRVAAYQSLNIESILAVVVDCDELNAELLQIDENLVRDDLTVLERAVQTKRRKAIYEQLHPGTRRGAAGGNARRGTSADTPSFAADTAKKTRQSMRSVQMEVQIANLPDEVIEMLTDTPVADSKTDLLRLARMPATAQKQVAQKVKDGVARSLTEANTQLHREDIQRQRDEIAAGKAKLPPGVFEVISMDVPWPIPDANCPYPTMSMEAIADLDIPAADDCILFFWTINRFMLRDTTPLLDKWGFREVGIITWYKGKDEDRMSLGQGKWLRNQTEHCVMAVKGNPRSSMLLTDQGTALFGERRKHSQKPESFYQLVDSLCAGRKLDYFSRQARVGWECFGNDTDKFPACAANYEKAGDSPRVLSPDWSGSASHSHPQYSQAQLLAA